MILRHICGDITYLNDLFVNNSTYTYLIFENQ